MKRCKYFAQGSCARGEKCPFFHNSVLNATECAPPVVRPNVTPRPASRDDRIRQVLQNRTAASPSSVIAYAHLMKQYPTSVTNKPSSQRAHHTSEYIPAKPAQSTRHSPASVACKYFLRGDCRNGTSCPYAHLKNIEEANGPPVASCNSNENEYIEPDDFSRELFGAAVQFEDGGRVSKVNLSGDFSTVGIRGLPLCSTPESASSLLNGLGFKEVSPQCVELRTPLLATTADAYVTVEDPTFPKTVYERLKSNNYPSSGLRIIRISTPTIISGTISRHISRRKVYISWLRPTRTARLSFASKEVADRVHEKFCRSVYKVLGQTVCTDQPKYSRPDGLHRGNQGAWTVALKDVPLDATSRDVERSLRSEHDRPQHLGFPKVKSSCDLHNIPAFIESLLTKFGFVEFDQRPSHQGQRFEAVARLNSDAGARKAVRTLHDMRQDFLNGGKLTVQLVSSAKFKIPTTVYDALKAQLTGQYLVGKVWDLGYKVHRSTDSLQRFTTLRIEGIEIESITSAADQFEKILTGEIIKDRDQPAWSTAFAGNGVTYHMLKQIQKRHSVAVIRDRMERLLTFFGPPEKYHQVQRDIMELIKSDSATTHVISLDPHELSWIRKGGFEQITTALGNTVTSLDIASEPKRVIITGSVEQYQTALTIIQGKSDSSNQRKEASTTEGETCAVCWTEAEDPILTKCNHTYCFECFENLCLSTRSSNKPFSICCQGEMGKCVRVFSLCELQVHLPSASFEDILEASFSSYINHHPQSFHYCPTPNCGYIYRPTTPDSPHVHNCSNCHQAVCTSCHGQHNRMLTCAEYKNYMSDGDAVFERYKLESDVKECPMCAAPIEKNGGCNHITCSSCAMHLCWVCLELFSDPESCYHHIRAKHEGL
ncbi:hypothetical protein AJ80_02735 [Polytolypa hystricis UAMH7299]|uniref:Uncharacterized protein n=1 Tax=Polytolypa hystricis (strain UAMH7299) TaxID=1447883 RepID=A0A2B7YPH7_POLH7|nr:hypothetical protein AJ80_02735 [Polytolypa hystricis UAMH7299]